MSWLRVVAAHCRRVGLVAWESVCGLVDGEATPFKRPSVNLRIAELAHERFGVSWSVNTVNAMRYGHMPNRAGERVALILEGILERKDSTAETQLMAPIWRAEQRIGIPEFSETMIHEVNVLDHTEDALEDAFQMNEGRETWLALRRAKQAYIAEELRQIAVNDERFAQ